ncbi:MAG: exopolysaccharide biosynthesis protein, partial [Verrucomicrobiota bacterium]
GIPGMPTALGSMVLILALQVLLHRENIWMPDWIQRRKLQSDKVCRGVQLARKPAAVVDRLMRPRLTFFTRHAGYWGIVALSALVAATMPPLEILPFVATSAGLILTLLALALITQDGLVALIAFLLAGSVSVYVAVEFI